jgi:hypothetical protein
LTPPVNQKPKNIEILGPDITARAFRIFRPDTATFGFNSYISALNVSGIKLKEDTTTIVKPLFFRNNEIVIADLEHDKSYKLLIDSNAIFYGKIKNAKPIQIEFSTYKKETRIAEMTITIDTSISNKNSIIYRVEGNKVTRAIPIDNKLVLRDIYDNQEVFHIAIDENKNGTWDTGNAEKERYPEKYYIETIALDLKQKEYRLKITNP